MIAKPWNYPRQLLMPQRASPRSSFLIASAKSWEGNSVQFSQPLDGLLGDCTGLVVWIAVAVVPTGIV